MNDGHDKKPAKPDVYRLQSTVIKEEQPNTAESTYISLKADSLLKLGQEAYPPLTKQQPHPPCLHINSNFVSIFFSLFCFISFFCSGSVSITLRPHYS
jgi:hypothetical protein